MAVSYHQPSMKNLMWEPVVAAECVVPWEVVRKVIRGPDRASFCSSLHVEAIKDDLNKEPLFFIIFNYKKTGIIEGVIRHPTASLSRELLVKSKATLSHIGKDDQGDKVEDNGMLIVPQKAAAAKELRIMSMDCLGMTQCSFTLKLMVYAARGTTAGASVSLNLARQTGSPFCDVLLRVDDHDFPAHKAVLSATSSVFSAMFCGDFKEKFAATVIIEGVGKVAFGRFLDFLYTEDVTSWEGSELELLDLSERYQVERLKARCEMWLWQLDGPRALAVLMEAEKWHVVTEAMKERLCTLVMANWQSVAESDEWRTLQSRDPVLAGLVKAGVAVARVTDVVSSVKVIHELPPL